MEKVSFDPERSELTGVCVFNDGQKLTKKLLTKSLTKYFLGKTVV